MHLANLLLSLTVCGLCLILGLKFTYRLTVDGVPQNRQNHGTEIIERLRQLEQKYAVMGQDMKSYLDGLLHADYLTYWDYIHLDTLLSLQNPRTPIPDERIFIHLSPDHRLYFRLMLDAIALLAQANPAPSLDLFKRQLVRINRYFHQLIESFDIMVDGMDRDEFLRFRMSLLPASGFQSVQYRLIEIASTDLRQLVHTTKREQTKAVDDVKLLCSVLYWRSGATELASGKKTLTLRQFEKKYSESLTRFAEQYRGHQPARAVPQTSAGGATGRRIDRTCCVNMISMPMCVGPFRTTVRRCDTWTPNRKK